MLKPLFKGLKTAPFVECPNCHSLTEYGSQKCLSCSHDLSTNDNLTIHIVMQNMGDKYTPFIECPNCRRLLKVGVRRCPDCYEEVSEEYALSSAITVVVNTVACDVANSIRSLDAFAVLVVILSGLVFALDVWTSGSPKLFYFVLIYSLMPLTTTALWFYRFGRFKLGDEEYLKAKRALIGTLMLWLGIISAQIIALVAWQW